MLKNTLIIILLLLVIYFYHQQNNSLTKHSNSITEISSEIEGVEGKLKSLTSFLQNSLGSDSLERSPDNLDKLLEELKTKLGEKTLDEILEANEDYETEVDTLTRSKNSLLHYSI